MKHREFLDFISRGRHAAALVKRDGKIWADGEVHWSQGEHPHGAFWPRALPLADLPDFPLFLSVPHVTTEGFALMNLAKCHAGHHYHFEMEE